MELARFAVRQGLTACLGADRENGAPGLPPILVVDGTCGNGHDTLFLAATLEELGGEVRVLALDVQAAAVASAQKRLEDACLGHRVCFAQEGHENLGVLLGGHRIAAAMYNLGYLPGSGKERITQRESTVASLGAALDALIPGGVLSVHAYGGHTGGEEEMQAVQAFFQELSFERWAVARYDFCNKKRNPERLFLATLRRIPGQTRTASGNDDE